MKHTLLLLASLGVLGIPCLAAEKDAPKLRAGTEVPTALGESGKTLKLHIFLDKSVMEVFINDGSASVTRVNYPGMNDLGIAVFSEHGSVTLRSLDVWQMKGIWE